MIGSSTGLFNKDLIKIKKGSVARYIDALDIIKDKVLKT